MVENALRGVVRQAISIAAADCLPGGHHFYVTFKTAAPGVEISDHLHVKYPDEMTIVIEHQFWDLTVAAEGFAITLSFNNRPERLAIPFAAITAFADPSVKFGLQFQEATSGEDPVGAAGEPRLRLAETPSSADTAPNAKGSGPKLVQEKSTEPRGKAKTERRSPDQGGAEPAKSAERKPGEVVTLDTFRKK